MTDPLASARQRLLEAVLAGDISPSARDVLDACASDPQFAAQLHQLQEVQSSLAQRAREIDEDLAEPAPELEDRIEAAMRARLSSPSLNRHRRSRWLLLAAAAAVLATASLLFVQPWGDRTDSQLLGELPVVATPQGLQFKLSLSRGQYFRVRVLDGRDEVYVSERLTIPEWRPDTSLVARWSRSFEVLVEAISSEGGSPQSARIKDWVPAAK